MTHRVGSSFGENLNFLTTGRPPDRNWMDMKRIRPRWTGNETRNTMDFGIEYTEDRYGPTPPQLGGRKRHADDDMLQRPYTDVPDSMGRMPWDGPHKRILYESKYKRQFERMTRPPGDDPAAFAIELETLARKAFVDVDASVRLQLVRDRFIIGQENRALRRHLDSVGPDTPISDIVDRCRVWESHDESGSEPIARHEPTGPRGVFQVTQQVSDEHNETSTEPDPAPSEYEILAQRLCEMAQQPVPGNSDTIDIEQLLKQLLPVVSVVEETGQPTPESQKVDDRASGNVA